MKCVLAARVVRRGSGDAGVAADRRQALVHHDARERHHATFVGLGVVQQVLAVDAHQVRADIERGRIEVDVTSHSAPNSSPGRCGT
jgi:hypothetical protein